MHSEQEYCIRNVSFIGSHLCRHDCVRLFALVMLIFINLKTRPNTLQCSLIHSLYSNFFLPCNQSIFCGRYFKSIQMSCSFSKFLPRNYGWSLPEPVFTMKVTNWWRFNFGTYQLAFCCKQEPSFHLFFYLLSIWLQHFLFFSSS